MMDRRFRVLYYRGIKYTTQFFNQKSTLLKELTYRGVTYLHSTTVHDSPQIVKTYGGTV